METMFTPGPWSANDWAIREGNAGHSPSPGMWEVDAPESGHTIALVLSQGDADVERANASVMAAAPKMYALLEQLAPLVEGESQFLEGEIQSLLKEARGESP